MNDPRPRPGLGPADLRSLPDEALAAQCVAGDQAAWRVLVKRYERLVFAVARRARLDEHASADVLQVVFSRLFEHLPRLTQPERMQAWIVTTARRETISMLRESARYASSASDESNQEMLEALPDESRTAEQQLLDLQESHRLRLALDRLDARCRDLLLMLFDHDRDEPPAYDEVAGQLGMPQGSIGPTRSRCLDKLRRLHGQTGSGGSGR